ncbi:MAG: dTDP-4-amino-4,6-dideoxygalactose transaminase [Erysipelotrichaceae bacterium]
MIKFNIPPRTGEESKYIEDAIESEKICGDGKYTKLCQEILEKKFNSKKIYLTTSGTSALEMACMLVGIEPGDEVIMPSFTFSSTATCVVLFGGVPVFVDIRKDTMNIDETKIEAAITEKTKAIMVVHYAGVGCNMEAVMDIARRHNLKVIEDAAQVVNAKYHGQYLGTFGDVGCYSFHETKNYSMGEGGAVSINNEDMIIRGAIVREKGTDRINFINGQVDKYTWVDKGSSYLPSDMLAAYLYPQLLIMDEMNQNRIDSFNLYYENLKELEDKGIIDLPVIPYGCNHNAHMFYIKVKDLKEREALQVFLRERGIGSAFHYIPLHSCKAGLKYGRFVGEDINTTKESDRLLRLPMYYKLTKEDVLTVCNAVKEFYNK